MAGRKAVSRRMFFKNRKAITKRSKNKREKLQTWSEERMQLAINECLNQQNNNDKLSLRSIARAYHVPSSTLCDRIKKPSNVVKPKIGRKTVFTETEENALVNLLKDMAKRGFGFTRLDIRRIAYEYAEKRSIQHNFSKKTMMAGYDWFQSFISRHKGLSVRKPENLSLARAMNVNEIVVNKHFSDLLIEMNNNDLLDRPECIWNLDESGLQDVFTSGDVVASSTGRVFNITSREKGETTTLLSAINASGIVAPHMIIFKGKRVKPELEQMANLNDVVRLSDSGWVKDYLIVEWGHIFLRFLRNKNLLIPGRKHILILDGHTTHSLNLKFIELMSENGIILWCLPPHTSHILQPLDKDVFCHLKREWAKHGKEFIHSIGGRVMTNADKMTLINKVLPLAFTERNIRNGFKRTGLYPFNPIAISPDSFLPSKNTELPEEHPVPDNQAIDDQHQIQIPEQRKVIQDIQVDRKTTENVEWNNFVKSFENPRKIKKKRSINKSPSQILTSTEHIKWVKEKTKTTSKTSNLSPSPGTPTTKILTRKTRKPICESAAINRPKRLPQPVVSNKPTCSKYVRNIDDNHCCVCNAEYANSSEDWYQCSECMQWCCESCYASTTCANCCSSVSYIHD